MSNAAFIQEAQVIAGRNLTGNVRAISASLEDGHLSVTYYVATESTIGDHDERETTVAELIAAFPEVKTADAYSEVVDGDINPFRNETIVFQR